MKEIVKAMLLEGIDVDTIHEVLDVILDKYQVVDEDTAGDFYKNKLAKVSQDLATAKSVKRHLNKTVDRKADQEYRKAAGLKSAIGQEYDREFDHNGDEDTLKQLGQEWEDADKKRREATNKYSAAGKKAYKDVIELAQKRDKLYDDQYNHNNPISHKGKKPRTF